MTNLFKPTPMALGILCTLYMGVLHAADGDMQFDTDILKNRGLDAGLSDYFSQSARFMPGEHSVTVKVNGRNIGKVTALFGDKGQLCVTERFLQGAGLVVPSAISRASSDASSQQQGGCYDYRNAYPTAVITPIPSSESVELVLPPDAVDEQSTGSLVRNYQTGGSAGILNYSAFATKSTDSGEKSTYRQAMLEEGVNMDDWLLRSRQSITQDDGQNSADNLYTYVQHTIVPWRKQIQAGEITTTGSLLSGESITGIQLTPEDTLEDDGKSGVQVTGIARNAQARVDIRQEGRIVYSTLVPAGAFTLTDIPILSTNKDLNVSVTETDGSVNRYVIPAATLNGNHLSSPEGLAVAMGRYRDEGDEDSSPWLATLSDGWRIFPWMNAGAGAMVAQHYDAIAGSLDLLPLRNMTVSAIVKVSDDKKDDHQGQSDTISVSYNLNQSYGVNASATKYSSGYREITDTLDEDFSQYTGQYSAGLHWSQQFLGTFYVGYTLSEGSNNTRDSRYINASWGRTIGKANVSVSWQTQVGQDDDNSRHQNTNDGDLFFVNVSFPLGGQQVNSYSRTRGGETTAGLQASGDITENSSYTIAADRDYSAQENDFSGSLDSNLHYARMGLSASTQGDTERSYGMAVSGGVVAHRHGLTFSSWPVKDTFAILDAGNKARGVEFSTPSGPVWTDYWGQAVVPSLKAYHNTRIEMNTNSLPDNVDVDNGFAQIAAGRGAVSNVNFQMIDVRKSMMNITMADGSILKKGSSIVDKKGNYIATVVDDGLIYIENLEDNSVMFVVDDDGKQKCQINYKLPDNQDSRLGYEKIKGVCK